MERDHEQSALSLNYIYIWLYTSCDVKKPSGFSSSTSHEEHNHTYVL